MKIIEDSPLKFNIDTQQKANTLKKNTPHTHIFQVPIRFLVSICQISRGGRNQQQQQPKKKTTGQPEKKKTVRCEG